MEFAARPQSIDEAIDWYHAMVDSILSHRATTLAAFHHGDVTSVRFFGLSYEEIDEFFLGEREELDGWAIVNVVAAAEAAIRIDYLDRVLKRYKDSLSQSYLMFHQSISAALKIRPPFDENGILSQMKDSGVIEKHIVSDFRDALRHRHWFAHGRYWTLKTSGNVLSPIDVHAVSKALLMALPM